VVLLGAGVYRIGYLALWIGIRSAMLAVSRSTNRLLHRSWAGAKLLLAVSTRAFAPPSWLANAG
jgi:hypothetical protein